MLNDNTDNNKDKAEDGKTKAWPSDGGSAVPKRDAEGVWDQRDSTVDEALDIKDDPKEDDVNEDEANDDNDDNNDKGDDNNHSTSSHIGTSQRSLFGNTIPTTTQLQAPNAKAATPSPLKAPPQATPKAALPVSTLPRELFRCQQDSMAEPQEQLEGPQDANDEGRRASERTSKAIAIFMDMLRSGTWDQQDSSSLYNPGALATAGSHVKSTHGYFRKRPSDIFLSLIRQTSEKGSQTSEKGNGYREEAMKSSASFDNSFDNKIFIQGLFRSTHENPILSIFIPKISSFEEIERKRIEYREYSRYCERKYREKLYREAAKKENQSGTDENGNDRPTGRPPEPPSGWTKKKWHNYLYFKSASRCKPTNVIFCDAHGNEKESFHPNDDIYVKVTFFNKTKRYACIDCGKGTFKRTGVNLELVGVEHKYTPTSPRHHPRVFLRPRESYTFFRLMSRSWANRINSWGTGTLIVTPEQEGTYTVRVNGNSLVQSDDEFQFKIVENNAAKDAKQQS